MGKVIAGVGLDSTLADNDAIEGKINRELDGPPVNFLFLLPSDPMTSGCGPGVVFAPG